MQEVGKGRRVHVLMWSPGATVSQAGPHQATGRLLLPHLVPANFPLGLRAGPGLQGGGELARSPRLIQRPEHSRAAPPGVGLSSDFGEVMMDTGHVATQWGHTTDLSHLGKLTLLSGGGGSVWELRAPAPASTAPMGSSPCLVEHRGHPRAHEGSSEAPSFTVIWGE